jgi:hypothetical protein
VATKKIKHQCIGEKRARAFELGGDPQWRRCENEADYLLDIKGEGGEDGYCCRSCYKDVVKSGQTHRIIGILTVRPLDGMASL